MRAFVAIDVTGEVAEALAGFQGEVSSTGADIKLVEKENLHLNLRFLGEIPEAQAEDVLSRLAKLSLKGGEAEVRGVGAFPAASRPRVVWAGIAPEAEGAVSVVAEGVRTALAGIGERDDRPFRAHITLGRVRSGRNGRELSDLLARNRESGFGKLTLAELKLKSSVLSPGGPAYRDLGALRLA